MFFFKMKMNITAPERMENTYSLLIKAETNKQKQIDSTLGDVY